MRPPRLRFSLRSLLAAVALVAIVIGTYCLFVEYPARWRRFRRADSLVRAQVELLGRLAEHERTQAREERRRGERIRLELEEEEAEALKAPDGSAEREQHRVLAKLWGEQAVAPIPLAKLAEKRASMYQARATAVAASRQQIASDLETLEAMARDAEKWLADDSLAEFPPELFRARSMVRVEQRLRENARSSFPTSFGPRQSVYEATAICSAENLFKNRFPNATVRATQVSRSRPYNWDVTFTEVKTGREFRVNTGFSEGTVYDYLKAHP